MSRTVSAQLALVGLAIVAAAPAHLRAANLETLTSFCVLANCADGVHPQTTLVADTNGNLYGTAAVGGAAGQGTAFEIAKTVSGYASIPTTLVSFCTLTNCVDGAIPNGLIADAKGNLFGTTGNGGANRVGTAFEIAKTSNGYAGSPTTFVSFCSAPNCADGANPTGPLIADAKGNLFGTTGNGGANIAPGAPGGTVFEILKTSSGYASTPTPLTTFCGLANCADGAFSMGGLIADADGNLFGTTYIGGANGQGTVFEIVKTPSGYAGTATTLVSFCAQVKCADGANPTAGLIADAEGNLFGTTFGGGANGHGTVFEIVKTASGYAHSPTTLVSFCVQAKCADGSGPVANLIADAKGNLFGTTSGGGSGNDGGTVFEIVNRNGGQGNLGRPGPPNYASAPTTLVSFCTLANCADGAEPRAGLIADAKGNLFGTTFGGGGGNTGGTVFEITGSGFLVSHKFDGTPGNPSCFGQSVSALAQKFGGLNGAADDLGHSSVRALQDAIMEFCEG